MRRPRPPARSRPPCWPAFRPGCCPRRALRDDRTYLRHARMLVALMEHPEQSTEQLTAGIGPGLAGRHPHGPGPA